MKRPRIVFRSLSHSDLPLLHEWLARPHVAEWWGEPPSLEDVERDYFAPAVRPFLAYQGDQPIGFIQVYEVMNADPDWWTDETDPGARGIDQFLADPTQLGRGLGTEMIARFVEQLFADPAVTKVQTDPAPDNARAIRAYEKVGFRRVGEVITPDGPALLMVRTR